jgi:serine-threonine kinase receptor-associated protein
LATGGYEKKLLLFDLSQGTDGTAGAAGGTETLQAYEVGPNIHQGAIKSIIWTPDDPNVLVTACEDKQLRWFDLRSRSVIGTFQLEGSLGSCEIDQVGGSQPTLSVASGKQVYFFEANKPASLIKQIQMPFDVASVALHRNAGKFVVGSSNDTWVRVFDFEREEETGKLKDNDVQH